MSTVIHERVIACREGSFEQAICKVESGWVVMGDSQFLNGYCLIYPDPVVPDLNALNKAQRQTLLYEVTVLGDAILKATGAVRCNYEILGNLAPALHVHVFPRFEDEAEELRTKPVWFYDWSKETFDLTKHKSQMLRVYEALKTLDIEVGPFLQA